MNRTLSLIVVCLLFITFGCTSTRAVKPADKPLTQQNPSPVQSEIDTDYQTADTEAVEEQPAETVKEAPITSRELPLKNLLGEIFTDNKTAAEPATQKISLNFDNADIYEVINSLSDLLGINYVIDSSVKGRVNIHTTTEIDRSRLIPILETIFQMNNIALVKFGDIYKIIPIKAAKKEMMDIIIGKELPDTVSLDRMMIQVVPFEYIPSSDVVNVLKPFVTRSADIVNYKNGNILIIVDTAASIRKLLKIVNIIDTDAFEQTKMRILKLENADVNDVSKELDSIFSSFGINKSTAKGIGLTFIPIERISCIIAVSQIPEIFEKVEEWLTVLDAVDLEAEEQVFIYFVENGKASEISDVLIKIYGEGVTEKKIKRQTTKKGKTTKTTLKGSQGTTMIQGKIKIVTDDTTNSIIVRATPHDYSIIKQTMHKLDIIPKQVMIEVLIAEVTLKGDTEFGIEWALLGDSATVGGYKGQDTAVLNFGMPREGGFTYGFDSNRLQIFLRAQASKNKLNILSSPHILAADNKEARIEVGEEVPIVTSEYVPAEQELNTSTSRSIEYRSTGVILSVIPRINDKGLVAMDIVQEVSEAQPVIAGGIQSPLITIRKAETSLVVQDGQPVIIGGMIKDQKGKTISSVPFLVKIPLLRYLFSNTQDTSNKTELLIMITPHVVNNMDEADLVTKEFQDKLGQINKLINKTGGIWEQESRRPLKSILQR